MHVLQSKSNWCANFQLKASKIRVRACTKWQKWTQLNWNLSSVELHCTDHTKFISVYFMRWTKQVQFSSVYFCRFVHAFRVRFEQCSGRGWPYIQGDHLSGKPGDVREFETCQGNVRDVVNSQGNVMEKILSWKSVPKLFITRWIFALTLAFPSTNSA